LHGEIKIQTAEAFENFVNMFPGHPELNKAFADFLAHEKTPLFACHEYCRSARQFLKIGKPAQAIGAKLQEWQLIDPVEEEVFGFLDTLEQGGFLNKYLWDCINTVSFPELEELIQSFSIMTALEGDELVKTGDDEDAIFVVLAGTLEQKFQDDEQAGKESSILLATNSICGDITPSPESQQASYSLKATDFSEVLKIPKSNLEKICSRHPHLEKTFMHIGRQAAIRAGKKVKNLRKAARQNIGIPIRVELFPKGSSKSPIELIGNSNDISLGGVCIHLDAGATALTGSNLINQKAQIKIGLPDDAVCLVIMGKLIWSEELSTSGIKSRALGIGFDNMPPSLGGLLVIFANTVGEAAMGVSHDEVCMK